MATVWVNGAPRQVAVGTQLSKVLSHAPHPCGGQGICGKCRVRATGALSALSSAEERHLTAYEIAEAIRLSCCVTVEGDCRVTVDALPEAAVLIDGQAVAAITPSFAAYGVAVDVGTTTIAARLYDATGNVLAQAGCPNPQTSFGADVLSRVRAAGEGADLTTPLQRAVNGLIRRLADDAEVSSFAIDGAVITGNTAMLCHLTGKDTAGLARAPFVLPYAFDETISAKTIGLISLSPDTAVYLPACAAAFIGADALCAALACGLGADRHTALLADMGTNGELLLCHEGELYACSTAAGPAFEGVGISCGMAAMAGAIDRINVINGGLVCHTIGGGKAKGICGSGLVDAATCLLALEEMDVSGYIPHSSAFVADGIILTQEDIRALQQAKSAVSSGLQTLLHRADLAAEAVEALYVAGGFGSGLNGRNAVAIGLLPHSLASCIYAVGNAALDGASMLLLDRTKRDTLAAMVANICTIELATDPYFADLFIKNMSF